MNGLTERRQRVLNAIRDLTARKGYPPTMREVAAEAGLNGVSGVYYQLCMLRHAGYVRWSPNTYRTLELVPDS
jgi:repressor LexA